MPTDALKACNLPHPPPPIVTLLAQLLLTGITLFGMTMSIIGFFTGGGLIATIAVVLAGLGLLLRMAKFKKAMKAVQSLEGALDKATNVAGALESGAAAKDATKTAKV